MYPTTAVVAPRGSYQTVTGASGSAFMVGGNSASLLPLSPIETKDNEWYLLNTYISSGACSETYAISPFWTVAAMSFAFY